MTMRRLVFFFSSRRRHTRLQGDWSSDVCSSDLEVIVSGNLVTVVKRSPAPWPVVGKAVGQAIRAALAGGQPAVTSKPAARSEERRVGKECRSRWSPYH